MADYYAILKRVIGGLAEPTGEARRSVYEKARGALVNQLKSFDPPISASEITQQRLQLEDAIRKVESESAKGLLSQALNRAASPDRQPARIEESTAPTRPSLSSTPPVPSTPTERTAPPAAANPTNSPGPMPPPPRASSRFTDAPPVAAREPAPEPEPKAPTSEPPTGTPPRVPTGRPMVSTALLTGTSPGAAAVAARMAKPQFDAIARPAIDFDRPATGPTAPTRGESMPMPPPPPPPGSDRAPTGGLKRKSASDTDKPPPQSYAQEDVTQPVGARTLKKAVDDIDKLGSASAETAKRARDALSATEASLGEELGTGDQSVTGRGTRLKGDRTSRPLVAGENRPAPVQKSEKQSRWPVVIGLVVATAVVGLGATALWMQRDLISRYLGSQKPAGEAVPRIVAEKPVVKVTDRLLPDEGTGPKPNLAPGVKVVTTQPITPGPDPQAGGQTEVAPGTTRTPTPAPSAALALAPVTLPNGDVLPISQRANLLEEPPNGATQPLLSSGTVVWQVVKEPAQGDKPAVSKLRARIDVPSRGISVILTMEPNLDASLSASHLIKVEFKLPADFDNKGVAKVPGVIMKGGEQQRGDPLVGATAKITTNLFWIALSAPDAAKARNLDMLKDRGWIDIPFVYDNNRRAMLTIEKVGIGDKVVAEALAAWAGGG